jgi:serine/threonine protein kinase
MGINDYLKKKCFRAEFLEEIRFMKNLGYHAHLLNMLGCVSNPRNPILVVEFCEHGDLLHALRWNKMRLKQVKSGIEEGTFFQTNVDTAIGDHIAAKASLELDDFDHISIAWQISDAMVDFFLSEMSIF